MTRKWNNLSKRGLALFLALVMCLGMLPAAAFAAGEETAVCPTCEGVGTIEGTCPDCEGTGKVSVTSECPDCEEPPVCEVCDGKGEVAGEVTVDCDICGGAGEVADPETEELADCEACEGTGKTTEEGLVSCEACADWEEPETCATCGGSRKVTTTEDCTACEGTGTVEHTCTACGGTGTVVKTAEPPEEDPVDTEAIAAAVGEVGADLQSLGDRFGAFQEEFFWNLTGDEEDPMADFTAAAAAEFGEEFNALLAKFKAIPAEVTETEYAGTYSELKGALQMMADAMGGDLNSGINALADMSWQWTVTVFGGNYYRADGTASSTNKYTINRHLDNSVSHEIGCSFVWNSSAGGSSYSGGWQLVLTVDGSIVERTTAYIYDRDMSTASKTWTAPASSHTGTSTHPFNFYASDYPKADYSKTKTFTLNYNANGGTNLSKAKDTYSGAESTHTFTPNATVSRTGYTFGGWSTASGANNAGNKTTSVSVSAGGSKTVYAIWTPIDYTIKYVDGVEDQVVFADQSYTKHYGDATPAFSGDTSKLTYTDNGVTYKFTGWSPTVAATVTDNATYTAQWEEPEAKPALTGISKELTNVKVNNVDKGASVPDTLTVGDVVVLTYKITVTGDAGAKYTVTDPGATPETTTGVLGSSKSAEITVTKTVTVAAGTAKISNIAYVKPTDSTTEPIPDDNDPKKTDPEKGYPSDPVENDVTVVNPADKPELTIEKKVQLVKADGTLEDDPAIVKTGSKVKYTITVTNTGAAAATNVVVTDKLPDGLSIDADSITGGGSYSSRTVTWNLGTLAATNGTAEVSFEATVTASGDATVENVAKVTSTKITTPKESDPVTITGKDMKIKVEKEAGQVTVDQTTGIATIPYTVKITNNGDPLYGLDILDVLTKITVKDDSSKELDPNLVSVSYAMNSFKLGDEAITAQPTGDHSVKVVAIDRSGTDNSNVFAKNQTVTLTYNVEVKNLSSQKVIVNLINKATGGSWVTDGSASFRMKAARASGGYDIEDSAEASASVGSATVVIPPAQGHKVTVKYVDENGGPISGKSDVVFYADKNTGDYNVTSRIKAPNGYAIISIDGKTEGTTDTDVTITVKCGVDAYKPTSPTDPTKKDGGDGIPDKFQPVVTYKVFGGTWDGTNKADKEYVFTLYQKDDTTGEWKELTTKPTLGTTVPNGMQPNDTHTADGAEWKDSIPESTTQVTGNVTYTYKFDPKGAEVTYPKVEDGKLPETDPDKDQTDSVEAGVKIIVNPDGGTWTPKDKDKDKWKAEDDKTFTRTANEGEQISLRDNPTKENNVFMGWEKTEGTESDGTTTITYTAQWTPDTLVNPKVPEDQRPATGDGIPDVWQATVTLRISNGAWGTTTGWTNTDGTLTQVYNLYEKNTETDKWEPKTVTVGTLPTSTANANYTGGSWTPGLATDTKVTGDASYTLSFSPVGYTTYTLSYNANNGSGAPSSWSVTVPTGSGARTTTVSTTRPSRSGYTFQGWNTAANGSGTAYGAGDSITLAGNVILYAQWSYNGSTSGGGTGGGGGGGGGTYRPSTGGGGGGGTTGGSTVDIGDEDVPLAGGSELNREDHFAYVSGYEDGTVRPTNNITREEVAAIFYRLLTETSRTIYETDVNDFSDVNSGRWSNRAISTLTNAGIISGYEDGSFRPGQSITRAEFATIAAQFEVVTEDVENPFSDTAGHWAETLISFAASKGWVGGYTDGTFKPQKAITRAEAMTLVNNVLEREVDEEGLLADAKQWPDNKKDAWYYYEVLEATNSHDYTRRGSGTVENWTAITND